MRVAIILVALTAVFTLGACGKRGTLERPPPMWGKGEPESPPPSGK